VHAPPDDATVRRRQLLRWRIQDTLFWVVGVVWIVFCTLFIATFLSNVAPPDRDLWMTAFAFSIFRTFALQPLEFGALLALVVWSCLRCAPRYIEKSKTHFGIQANMDMEVKDAAADTQPAQPAAQMSTHVSPCGRENVPGLLVEIEPSTSTPRNPNCQCGGPRMQERDPYPDMNQACFWCSPEQFLGLNQRM